VARWMKIDFYCRGNWFLPLWKFCCFFQWIFVLYHFNKL